MSADDRQVARLVNDVLEQRIDRRRFFRRAAALGLSIPVASAIFAACGGTSGGSQAAGGGGEGGGSVTAGAVTGVVGTGGAFQKRAPKLTARLDSDMAILDPAFYPSSADYILTYAIYEGLVTFKPGTINLVNQLAETFTPSSDGLSYDFKLKEGVQFHENYGEMTTEDVKYSFERIAGLTKPNIQSSYSGDWSPQLQEVAIKNKYEGTIVLREPFAAVLRSTLPVGSGYILSKQALEERGEKFGQHPVGTGPYQFESWAQKQKVVLKRFDAYSGAFSDHHGTIFDEMDFLVIPDDDAADIALETGAADFGRISLKGVDRFGGNDQFKTFKQPTLNYNWIGMNVLQPKLSDIHVRKAIRLAIDVPGILEAAFEGKETRATAIIPPNMGIGYWPDAPVYDRDVDQAKALMADAGVSSLGLELVYYEGDIGAKDVVQISQANLADIGIKVSLRPEDSATFNTLGKSLRQRELMFVGYVTEPDPSWSTVWFICKQFDEWNWMYWCNHEFDRLHFAALKELDDAKRSDMYVQMQKIWDAACDAVWIYWPTLYFGSRKSVTPSIFPTGYWYPPGFTLAA